MKSSGGFMKGACTGMMVGVVASVAGAIAYKTNKKSFKKQAGKAVKAVGTFVDNVQGMMR